jgi:hypothetical protein
MNRFSQTHVAERSFLDLGLKLRSVETGPDLQLKWNASMGGILNSGDLYLPDLLTDGGKHTRKVVHEETRIDACPYAGNPVVFAQSVNTSCESGLGLPREGKFLTGGNHTHFGLGGLLNLSLQAFET